MWKRRLIYISGALLLILVGCGPGADLRDTQSGFRRIEDPGVQVVNLHSTDQGISRNSGKIQATDLKADWNDTQMVLHGKFSIDHQDLGNIELKGTRKDNVVVLEPVSSRYKDSLKAKVFCTSDEGQCADFFIDLFYQEEPQSEVFHDQYVMDNQQASAVQREAPEQSDDPATSDPSLLYPSVEAGDVEIISSDAHRVDAGYVGTTDQEIKTMFQLPKMTKPPVTKAETQMRVPVVDKTAVSTPKKNISVPTVSDQAINAPYFDKSRWVYGKLQNPTNFLQLSLQGGLFKILWPDYKRYYGTTTLANLLLEMSQFMRSRIPNYQLLLGSIASLRGGTLPGQSSHQNGLDMDVAYVSDNAGPDYVGKYPVMVSNGKVSEHLRIQDQWALLKRAFQTGFVEVVFVDAAIKKALCTEAIRSGDLKSRNDRNYAFQTLRRILPEARHANHFHVRAKCTQDQPRCYQALTPLDNSGC